MLGDEEVGFTEEDYIGLFDETPIPRGNAPVVKPAASAPPPPPAAPAESGS